MTDAELDRSLARLARRLTVHDRLSILRQLIEYWHGPIKSDYGILEHELQGKTFPLPLGWLYRLIGKRLELLCWQNYIIKPEEYEADNTGRSVFYNENQGVYSWATVVEGEDPPVWGKFNGPTDTWTQEGTTLSECLIQVCIFEASMCFTAPYGARAPWADESVLRRVIAPLHRLPIAPWHWPGYPTQFYTGKGVFVTAAPYPEEQGNEPAYCIEVGAKTGRPLEYLREFLGDAWEDVEF
jgi:hypothetical protein